jgi:hyperosmotically inducible protein
MKKITRLICTPVLVAMGALTMAALMGCTTTSTKTVDVTDGIRKSLDQAGLKDVSVKQDRDLGVVTLGGTVKAEDQKAQAEAIAKSMAGNQVVADQVAVRPAGVESDARKIDADLDKGIEANLDAALVAARLRDYVKYSVKNGVVTLSGEVSSQTLRAQAETVASGVPNVHQVVNTLQVKGQKATSSN